MVTFPPTKLVYNFYKKYQCSLVVLVCAFEEGRFNSYTLRLPSCISFLHVFYKILY